MRHSDNNPNLRAHLCMCVLRACVRIFRVCLCVCVCAMCVCCVTNLSKVYIHVYIYVCVYSN